MISLLIVNYRSAPLAAEAIRTAREGTSTPLQIVVVDNGLDEGGVLRPIADVVITPPKNLGYAGGINLGRRSCEGETLIVGNPDVKFAKGALDRLHDALDDRTAVAGPALYWDDALEWILPPSDLDTTAQKLDQVFASRSRRWFEQRDRRRIRKRVAFWTLERTTEVRALSGAVMAIRAADFIEFDERFPLYFEEIDFLRRMMAMGKRIVYVPGAKCRHLYNQSAGQDSTAAGTLYAASELRYLEKWSGPFAARALKRFERSPDPMPARPWDGPIPIEGANALVEVSPLATFSTAAGHFPRSHAVELPPEVWATVRTEPLYFRTVDRSTARVLATYAVSRPRP